MMGAIIGDIIGSRFEHRPIKRKQFRLFHDDCRFTDDTVATCAVAKALLEWDGSDYDALSKIVTNNLQDLGRNYPYCGWGYMFRQWIFSDNPQPYGSAGNGAAMRISPVAWAMKDREFDDAQSVAFYVTAVSHDPVKCYDALELSEATWFALQDFDQFDLRRYVWKMFEHHVPTVEEISRTYKFDVTCHGTVPYALFCVDQADNFVDAIRNAVCLGGDSDTLAACAGTLAEAKWGIPSIIRDYAETYLDDRLLEVIHDFEEKYPPKIV